MQGGHMGKLTELLAELADEEGLDPDELEALLEVVKRRKAASGGGKSVV